MVVDTSAIITILLDEPERAAFAEALETSGTRRISTVSLVETSIVIEARFGAAGIRELDQLLKEANVETVAFDQEQALLAREAYRLFGKVRHPAALNFGDCCSYALASTLGEPMLYKGDDFSQTDIASAV
jgi:ribonuclease VapC